LPKKNLISRTSGRGRIEKYSVLAKQSRCCKLNRLDGMQLLKLKKSKVDRGAMQEQLLKMEKEARELRSKSLESTKKLAQQQSAVLSEQVRLPTAC